MTKSSFFSTLLVFFFPLALAINLVNFLWVDIVFVLMTIAAITASEKTWPEIQSTFGLKNKLFLCCLTAYFLSGILGYILYSPMEANELTKIGNLRWIWGFFACFSAGYLLAHKKIKFNWYFLTVILALAVIIVRHFDETSGKFLDSSLRIKGFYSNPNYFAMAVALLWATMLPFVIYARNTKSRIGPAFVLFLAGIILLATYTRTSWIAMLMAVAVALVYSKNKKMLTVSALIIGFFGLAILFNWFNLKDRILYSFDIKINNSQGERIAVWKAAWSLFLDHPTFGTGFEYAAKLFREYYIKLGQPTSYVPGHTHNQFLDVLTGAGLVGLVGFLGAFGSGVVFFHKKFKTAVEVLDKQIALGSILCIVAFFSCSFTETPIIQQGPRNYILIILGFSYGYLSGKGKKQVAAN
ncbi:O-antigen ligase family protein [Bdellovibrio sp. HCB-162]|uniref:O-antigen ligase family protein n=1 Tax=Bdellovibrio sp. HCB-162 TaxID=3394234 RepID=UPI0039BCEC0F